MARAKRDCVMRGLPAHRESRRSCPGVTAARAIRPGPSRSLPLSSPRNARRLLAQGVTPMARAKRDCVMRGLPAHRESRRSCPGVTAARAIRPGPSRSLPLSSPRNARPEAISKGAAGGSTGVESGVVQVDQHQGRRRAGLAVEAHMAHHVQAVPCGHRIALRHGRVSPCPCRGQWRRPCGGRRTRAEPEAASCAGRPALQSRREPARRRRASLHFRRGARASLPPSPRRGARNRAARRCGARLHSGPTARSCGSGAGQLAQARQEEAHKVYDERHGQAAADADGYAPTVALPPRLVEPLHHLYADGGQLPF